MDLFDAISDRPAVHKYGQDLPSDHELRQLVEAATWVTGAKNAQAWHFTVITRRRLLDQIARRARAWTYEHDPWTSQDRELKALADPHFDMLHHAPVLIVISAPAVDNWTAEACAVAAQNLMLAATSLGLSSCWVGLAQNWLNSSEGRQAIGLPADERVVAPLVVGYASEGPGFMARRKPVITWIGDELPEFENGEPIEPGIIEGLSGSSVSP